MSCRRRLSPDKNLRKELTKTSFRREKKLQDIKEDTIQLLRRHWKGERRTEKSNSNSCWGRPKTTLAQNEQKELQIVTPQASVTQKRASNKTSERVAISPDPHDIVLSCLVPPTHTYIYIYTHIHTSSIRLYVYKFFPHV